MILPDHDTPTSRRYVFTPEQRRLGGSRSTYARGARSGGVHYGAGGDPLFRALRP